MEGAVGPDAVLQVGHGRPEPVAQLAIHREVVRAAQVVVVEPGRARPAGIHAGRHMLRRGLVGHLASRGQRTDHQPRNASHAAVASSRRLWSAALRSPTGPRKRTTCCTPGYGVESVAPPANPSTARPPRRTNPPLSGPFI